MPKAAADAALLPPNARWRHGGCIRLGILALFLLRLTPAHGRPRWGASSQSHAVGRLPFPEETQGEEETIEDDIQHMRGENEDLEKMLRTKMGDYLVSQRLWECNIFGGAQSCSPMSLETGHKEQCPMQNNKVDCALKGAVEEAFSGDFYGEIGTVFNDTGLPPCETCINKLRQFWCAQAVPTCGTFDGVIKALLPSMQEILVTRESGRSALKKLMPELLHAMALGLPSQELCQQVVLLCTCGSTTSFGEVVDMIEMGDSSPKTEMEEEGVSAETDMSPAMAEDLFQNVRDWKLCDVFVPSSTEGFQGLTEWVGYREGGTFRNPEEGECGWCESYPSPSADTRRQEAQALFERVVVSQMARSVSSIMRAGLQHVLDAAGARDPRGGTDEDRKKAADEAIQEGQQAWNWTDPISAAIDDLTAEGNPAHEGQGEGESEGGHMEGKVTAPAPAASKGTAATIGPSGEESHGTENQMSGAEEDKNQRQKEEEEKDGENQEGTGQASNKGESGAEELDVPEVYKRDGEGEDEEKEKEEEEGGKEKGSNQGSEGGSSGQEPGGEGQKSEEPEEHEGTQGWTSTENKGKEKKWGGESIWQGEGEHVFNSAPETESKRSESETPEEPTGEHVFNSQETQQDNSQESTPQEEPQGKPWEDEHMGGGGGHMGKGEGEGGGHMGEGPDDSLHKSMHSAMHDGGQDLAHPEEGGGTRSEKEGSPMMEEEGQGRGERRGHFSWATVFFLFASIGVIVAGVLVVKKWQDSRRRTHGEMYINLHEMGYQPPVL